MRFLLTATLALAAGCGASPSTMLPATDAGSSVDRPAPSCALAFEPRASLALPPNARVTLQARLSPATDGEVVRFGLIGDAADAALLSTEATVDVAGVASTVLVASTDRASFRVRATAPCGVEVYVDVTVSERQRGEIVAEAVYRGARRPLELEVLLVPGAECLPDPAPSASSRATVPLPGATVRFGDLPDNAQFVLQGRARGDGVTLAQACAGPVRAGASSQPVPLVFVDAALGFGPSYNLRLQADLSALAAASSERWIAAVRGEVEAAGGDGAVFAPDLVEAVTAAAPTDERDSVRREFTARFSSELAPLLATALSRREASPAAVFSRIASATASALASPVVITALSQDPSATTVYRAAAPIASIDPGTPDVASDDATTTFGPSGAVALALGPGDTVTAIAEPLPLPFTQLAASALGAVIRRLGATTSAALVDAAVCPVLSAALRDATMACDDACVAEACRATVRRLADRFDSAVTTDGASRAEVTLRFSGLGRPAVGGLEVDRVEGVAAGRYLDDASATVLASAALSRVPPP